MGFYSEFGSDYGNFYKKKKLNVKEEISKDYKSDLKEEIQKETKSEVKKDILNKTILDIKKEILKETKSDLKEYIYKENKLDVKNDISKEVLKEKHEEISEKYNDCINNFSYAPFCKDAADNIFGKLKNNNFDFHKYKTEEVGTVLGYLSTVLSGENIAQDQFLEFKKHSNDNFYDIVFDIYKQLDKPTQDLFFEKEMSGINEESKKEIWNSLEEKLDLKDENLLLKDKINDISKENQILKEELSKLKEEKQNLIKGTDDFYRKLGKMTIENEEVKTEISKKEEIIKEFKIIPINDDIMRDHNGISVKNKKLKQEIKNDIDYKDMANENGEPIGNPTILKEKDEDVIYEPLALPINQENLKENLKKIEWKKISSDWVINYRPRYNSPFKKLKLDPHKDCTKKNYPLYRYKIWLEHLYDNLELSFRSIAKLCNVDKGVIIYWAKKHGISKREDTGEWIDSHGYVKVYTSVDYYHPELKPLDRGEGRFVRHKHDLIIEDFLIKHPELEISKICLIDGKYLKSECTVHHINCNKLDNEIENLWAYRNRREHMLGQMTLFNCFSDLIKLDKITFKDGQYYLNRDYEISNLTKSQIQEILAPKGEIMFKDINNVKKAIKSINWDKISLNWIVKYRQNQFVPYVEIQLNPYSDCSEDNPLYRYKDWLNCIVHDTRFNLTDSRLGELCGISRDKAREWRRKLEVSRGREWGFNRFINKKGRIFIKPENYNNPVAIKNNGWVLEHRYIIEQHLNNYSKTDIAKKYLNENGYLKSVCQIHHINLDPSDNKIENLFMCPSIKDHKLTEYSLFNYTKELLKSGLIVFNKGKYKTNI